ncbi:MAG: JmjC domain-containing protein [Acidimicrobiia bacterium]
MTLRVDPGAFTSCFAKRAFTIEHDLAAHPLLQLDALAELADALPSDLVEHHLGDVPLVLPGGVAAGVDESPGAIVRGLESNQCWISLRHVERVPAYAALVVAAIDDVAPEVEQREGKISRREGFMFLASRDTVTPVHCDPEHNFLLQLRGTKRVNVGEFSDPEVLQREMELQHQGGHRNVATLPDSATEFLLEPGVGIYIPPDTPHWVTNGPGVTSALSLPFYTPVTARGELVHSFNGWLRRKGRSPRPPGQSVNRDRAKATVVRVRSATRRLRRSPSAH